MISERKLQFWLDNSLNVLLIGRHGVGKSTIVADLFNKKGLNWKYFSAATMDPWVDFIGIPKEKETEDGKSHLELIPPKDFAEGDVEAIFIDEFNRAHKKVRNAVMELIQFKSINGRKFKNLKVVWAAINPEDDPTQSYDVEALDPAQRDRFQVHLELPYKPSRSYFGDKYGSEVGNAAVEWWKNLSSEIQEKVSPRRLDYALEMHFIDGSMRDVLPRNSNVRQLQDLLKIGAPSELLKNLYKKGTPDSIKTFFRDENKYRSSINLVLSKDTYLEKFFRYLPSEKISSLIAKEEKCLNYALSHEEKYEIFSEILTDIVQGRVADEEVIKRISRVRRLSNQENTLESDGYILDMKSETLSGRRDLTSYQPIVKETLGVVQNSYSNTNDRVSSIRTLISNYPSEELPSVPLEMCLRSLDYFLDRSHSKTLRRVGDLVRYTNALILTYVQGKSEKFENFLIKYPSITQKLEGEPGFAILEV